MPFTELTEEKALQICELIAEGQTRAHSAEAIGVHRTTLWRWLQQAKREPDSLFATLATLIKMAEAQAVCERVRRIRAAGQQGTWVADAWWLERRQQDDFALKDRKAFAELTAELKEMRAEIRELRQQNEAAGQAGEAGAFRRNGHATGQKPA